jgi:hypothetical protein
MRVGLMLLSLLVVLGIMLMAYKTVTLPSVEVGHKAEDTAQEISGHDANGAPIYKSYKCQPVMRGNQLIGIDITELTPGGGMEGYYGLKVDDVVLQIAGTDVATFGDYDSAKGQLDEAAQHVAPLLVNREGTKITLPIGGGKSPLDKLVGN